MGQEEKALSLSNIPILQQATIRRITTGEEEEEENGEDDPRIVQQ